MAKASWHIRRDGDVLTLSRPGRTRLDVSAVVAFPKLARGRLAAQMRQDIWRALQDLRGFSPVVVVHAAPGGLTVQAGGQVDARTYPIAHINTRLSKLLNDPDKRARWIKHAQIAGHV